MTLEHLKAWRLYRGLTQSELARRIAVSKRTIIRIEQGGSTRNAYARLLAMALGIDFEVLRDTSPPQ